MGNSRSSPPEDLRARFRAALVPYVAARAEGHAPRLVVAFSGGLDSSVLLHLLAELAAEGLVALRAAHVHHGLSDHAEDWVQHCQRVCERLGVPLAVLRVAVDRAAPRGIEAAARDARYAALATLAADWLVLGHHADDQAETLVHRLIRGAGVRGAAAMRPADKARRLLRPLLHVPRRDLEDFARAQGLSWVEDDSNPDTRLTRNYLRHVVLSPLLQRFPYAALQMGRAARHFAEAGDLLDELAAEDLLRLRASEGGSRQFLRALSASRAANLVRHWLALHGCGMPDEDHLAEGLRQLRSDAVAVCWEVEHWQVCAYRGSVWVEPVVSDPIAPVAWQGEAVVAWGGGELRFAPSRQAGALRVEFAADPLQLRTRAGGERLRLASGRPSRSIKALCQEAGIPPWWRDRLPMLWQGSKLVWVGKLGGDADHATRAGEQGWQVEWVVP